jgi:hypothetical protein
MLLSNCLAVPESFPGVVLGIALPVHAAAQLPLSWSSDAIGAVPTQSHCWLGQVKHANYLLLRLQSDPLDQAPDWAGARHQVCSFLTALLAALLARKAVLITGKASFMRPLRRCAKKIGRPYPFSTSTERWKLTKNGLRRETPAWRIFCCRYQ